MKEKKKSKKKKKEDSKWCKKDGSNAMDGKRPWFLEPSLAHVQDVLMAQGAELTASSTARHFVKLLGWKKEGLGFTRSLWRNRP